MIAAMEPAAFFLGVCLFTQWWIFFFPQVRSGCAFMVHVCQDEHQLYNEFFSKPTPKLEWVSLVCFGTLNHTAPTCLYLSGIEESVQPQFDHKCYNLIQGAEVNFWCYYPTCWSNTASYSSAEERQDKSILIHFYEFDWLNRALHFYLHAHVIIFLLMVFRCNYFL